MAFMNSTGFVAAHFIAGAQDRVLGTVGEPTLAALVDLTALLTALLSTGCQQLGFRSIAYPTLRTLECSTGLLTTAVIGRVKQAILGGILHIAVATHVMFTGLLAALLFLLWNALQSVLRDFPAHSTFHQGTGLGTAFLPGDPDLIHLQVVHGPSLPTGHQRAARLAADLVRVAQPRGAVLRRAPQDAAGVELTGLGAAFLVREVDLGRRTVHHAIAVPTLEGLAGLVAADFG